jgi:hypothetical protein
MTSEAHLFQGIISRVEEEAISGLGFNLHGHLEVHINVDGLECEMRIGSTWIKRYHSCHLQVELKHRNDT